MASTYYPRTDSFPAQVVGFFANNPTEELSIDNMVDKFMPASRTSIHTQLAAALEAKLLVRRRDEDGDYIYSRGPKLKITSAAGAEELLELPGKAKAGAVPAKRSSALDFSSIVIRDDVPKPKSGRRGNQTGQLQEWLEKLAPGQSFEIPAKGRSALNKAVQKLHAGGVGKFSIHANQDAGTVGVWCDEKAQS